MLSGWRRTVLLLLAMAMIGPSLAGTQHVNQLVLRKESPNVLRFDLQVNPAEWLHQLMAPQTAFPEFLKTHAALPEPDFRKILAQAIRKLETENFVQLPSGEKLAMLKWQLPPAPELQELLKKNLLIIDLPAPFQAHLEPIAVSASLQSRKPMGRIQLTLSAVFHPILLTYQQDRVWFTPFIPTSLIDL